MALVARISVLEPPDDLFRSLPAASTIEVFSLPTPPSALAAGGCAAALCAPVRAHAQGFNQGIRSSFIVANVVSEQDDRVWLKNGRKRRIERSESFAHQCSAPKCDPSGIGRKGRLQILMGIEIVPHLHRELCSLHGGIDPPAYVRLPITRNKIR